MAGRGGRMGHPPGVGPRGPSVPLPAQAALLRGPPAAPWNGQPVPPVQLMQAQQVIGGAGAVEHKLQTQHAEIQRLMTDNQRLAATHVALRQELAAAQGEGQRLQQVVSGMQAEKEAQMRGLMEKAAKMEADLRAVEPLKAELQAMRGELQNVHARRQELEQAANQQIQQLTQDGQKMRADLQQLSALRQECENLRQELQRARGAAEFEKKANLEHQEHRKAMEKNLVTMARDVEKLRAELTVAKSSRPNGAGQFSGSMPGQEAAYPNPALQRTTYGEGYGSETPAMPGSGTDAGAQYGHPQATAWGQQAYGQDATKTDPYSVAGAAGYGAADAASAYGAHQDASFSRPGDVAYPGANAEPADPKAADGWTEHQAPDGKIFYFNSQTGASQWEKPQAMLDREAQAAAAAASAAIPIPHPSQMAPGQGQQDHSVPQGSQYIPPPGFSAPPGWMNQAQPQGPGGQPQYGQPPYMGGHYGQPEGVPPQQGINHPYGQSQGTPGQRLPGQQGPGAAPQQGPIQSPARAQQQQAVQPGPQGQAHRQQNQVQGGGRPGQQQQMNQAHVSARPILNPKPERQEPVKSPQTGAQIDNPELPPQGPNGANLFVFGFPDDFTDQKLAALFGPFGKTLNAKVGVDQTTGRSKGYGFVSMESVKAADAAIQGVNGQIIAGRRVKVERKRGDHDQIQQQQHVPPGGGPGPNRFRHEQQQHVGYRPY